MYVPPALTWPFSGMSDISYSVKYMSYWTVLLSTETIQICIILIVRGLDRGQFIMVPLEMFYVFPTKQEQRTREMLKTINVVNLYVDILYVFVYGRVYCL